MSISDTLKSLNKKLGHKKAKTNALDKAKHGKTLGDTQTYSPGYGHEIDKGHKKPAKNIAQSNLMVSFKRK